MKTLERALLILAVMTIGLMALGAGVRTMNAGLACPDWPLCFGKVIPDFHVGVYFEFIHRAYAGLVAILFFALSVWVWRSRDLPKAPKRLGIFAAFVLVAQIVMGGLTVLGLLKAGIVTSHLMLATFFYSAVLGMYLHVRGVGRNRLTSPSVSANAPKSWPRGLAILAQVFPVFVLLQIFLGGLVASTYSGLVCVDFPLCNGQWIPTLTGPIGLQVLHRLGAYTVFCLGVTMAIWLFRTRHEKWSHPADRRSAYILMILLFCQVGVGILNLKMLIPPSITVLHQLLAMMILGNSWFLAFAARPQKEASAVRVNSIAFSK